MIYDCALTVKHYDTIACNIWKGSSVLQSSSDYNNFRLHLRHNRSVILSMEWAWIQLRRMGFTLDLLVRQYNERMRQSHCSIWDVEDADPERSACLRSELKGRASGEAGLSSRRCCVSLQNGSLTKAKQETALRLLSQYTGTEWNSKWREPEGH
jgi:hypothetical protein